MAAYTKLNLAMFKERLASDQYGSATGARRGVGKSTMTAAEKTKALELIEAHFGNGAKAAKPAAKSVAKRSPAPVAKTGTAPKQRNGGREKSTQPAAKPGRGRKAEEAPVGAELNALQAGATTMREALAGLAAAADLSPSLDVKAPVARGVEILTDAINRIGNLLGSPSASPVEDEPAEEPGDTDEPADEPEDKSSSPGDDEDEGDDEDDEDE